MENIDHIKSLDMFLDFEHDTNSLHLAIGFNILSLPLCNSSVCASRFAEVVGSCRSLEQEGVVNVPNFTEKR